MVDTNDWLEPELYNFRELELRALLFCLNLPPLPLCLSAGGNFFFFGALFQRILQEYKWTFEGWEKIMFSRM